MLDRKLKSLHVEKVGWDATVVERRKRVPRNIHVSEADLEKRRSAAEWMEEGDDEDGIASGLRLFHPTQSPTHSILGRKTKSKAADIPPPPRHEETIETFNNVVENLTELTTVRGCRQAQLGADSHQSVPAQLARAQRARTVREEIAKMPA